MRPLLWEVDGQPFVFCLLAIVNCPRYLLSSLSGFHKCNRPLPSYLSPLLFFGHDDSAFIPPFCIIFSFWLVRKHTLFEGKGLRFAHFWSPCFVFNPAYLTPTRATFHHWSSFPVYPSLLWRALYSSFARCLGTNIIFLLPLERPLWQWLSFICCLQPFPYRVVSRSNPIHLFCNFRKMPMLPNR